MFKIDNIEMLSNVYINICFSSFKKQEEWWKHDGVNWWDGSYSYDNDLLYYIADGTMTLNLNGKEYTASSGQMVYIPRQTEIVRRVVSERVLVNYYTNFKITFSNYSITDIYEIPYVIDVEASERGGVVEMFERLSDCHRDLTMENAIKARGVLLQLLSFYIKRSNAIPLLSGNKIERNMQSVIRYINSNLGKRITVAELSALTGYNKDYFTRLFKQNFRCLPQEYIARLRINKAKKQLRNTDLPISAIADGLGFFDSGHFGKFFRSRVGVSPSEYRNNVRFKI